MLIMLTEKIERTQQMWRAAEWEFTAGLMKKMKAKRDDRTLHFGGSNFTCKRTSGDNRQVYIGFLNECWITSACVSPPSSCRSELIRLTVQLGVRSTRPKQPKQRTKN
jgi:hypothetical protein